ncbi:MAG: 2-oxoacid:ferredoxin oxidoreductase subunit delta [Bacillales bacterium]|jgi:2-oxoglutarate ferredoxin oxidoreductase subunit delta|nr:2-oxoacid:ferredoxin oxidoreductase subunit delta [Bacillales bacterium]
MGERVVFEELLCKSCSLCISVCPKNIIYISNRLNEKGYLAATVENQDECISCAKCAMICPDSVITVFRPEVKREARRS